MQLGDSEQEKELRRIFELLGLPYYKGIQRYSERFEILPHSVRGLIILMDEISDLPWVEVQDWARFNFSHDLLPILALLCGSAYYNALAERLDLSEEIPTASFKDLRRKKSEELRDQMRVMQNFLETLEKNKDYDATHPVAKATHAYLNGPWFEDLLALPTVEDEDALADEDE